MRLNRTALPTSMNRTFKKRKKIKPHDSTICAEKFPSEKTDFKTYPVERSKFCGVRER